MDSTLDKQLRLRDVAKAFGILATNPAATFGIAENLNDADLTATENVLRHVVATAPTDVATGIEAVLGNPLTPPVAVVTAAQAANEDADPGLPFRWKKTGKRGANAEDVRFDCKNWNGLDLSITKHGAADYEGFINGASVLRGKFVKNVRERTEKEAKSRI